MKDFKDKIKILIGPSTFGQEDCAPLKLLKDSGFEPINNPHKRKLTKEEVLGFLTEDVQGLIAGLEPLDREVLTKSGLKVISRCGSGVSNVDLKAARSLGIKVCSTPDGPTVAVAELTVGALLNLLRRVSYMDSRLHAGKWVKQIGFQLQGKTIAIIGFGRIGRRVAMLLKNFGVKLIAVDPALKAEVDGVKITSFKEAVKKADIISIHLSGEKEVIGFKEIEYLKNGVFILNAARGGLINEEALIEALENKKVAGAWLDVFDIEPYQGPLKKYPQVLLTPHVGSYTLECRRMMEMDAVENLISAFNEVKTHG